MPRNGVRFSCRSARKLLPQPLLLTAAWLLLTGRGVGAQKVRVEEELEAYPNESVDLRCQFIDSDSITKLTQVSWIWEPTEGQRDNIAVFHPMYGQSFPDLAFKDRVAFLHNKLVNPSIRISDLRMSDAGRYTCEYATYPTGNEQATTTLVMLAKPKNSANVVTVQAGTKAMVVAQCQAADAKPAATIKWLASVGGNHTTSSTAGPDGTVTVRSEYRLVPTPADDGREVTCMVDQRTQDKTWTHQLRLSVEYPPSVSIEGYDHNWFMGRSDAVLVCTAKGNPQPTTVTWTAASGPLPDSVLVDGNKLTVRKVDDTVNTTFICEVKNKHGAAKHQITTFVIEEERRIVPGPSTGAVIGGLLGALALIGIVVGLVFFIRRRQRDADGPPKHKPPPPIKSSGSTELLTKPSEAPAATEMAPLTPAGDVYYEPTGSEPVRNFGSETPGAANGGGPPLPDEVNLNLDPNPDLVSTNQEPPPTANIARGESFVSPAMYV
ncbi:poliovirus receptor-like isoform X2 [Syngnathus typhle]|uniref:poliovirus receptor-like isoform X2 n=1 Tax=Syngnathus typhle TaxID=161592 RepID=UPI002A698C40|nr:poliovirus receptor-like isoform X2 [Syngnathus typhle]